MNTNITDLNDYLQHILKSTNMKCLTPEKVGMRHYETAKQRKKMRLMLHSHGFRQTIDSKLDIDLVDESMTIKLDYAGRQ